MSAGRLRIPLILLAAGLGLSACAYDDGYGYGYGRVSAGYGGYGGYGGCDPYWDDCYSGYGGGYAYDPWFGWYGDYYYPGIGIYVFDRSGRRYRWNEDQSRYWGSRRQNWGDRNWNDRRWERWQGYRGDRSNRQQWDENRGSFRREGMRDGTAPRVQGETRVRTDGTRVRTDGQRSRGGWRGRRGG